MTTVSQEAREARIEHLRAEIRRCDLAIEQGTADNWWHIDRDRLRQELDSLTEPRHRHQAERETLARMEAEIKRLREALDEIRDLPGEINPCNYDHDDACELNRQFCYALTVADAALNPPAPEAGR